MLTLSIAAALLLDRLVGEPRWLHPLVGFGRVAGATEDALRGWVTASGSTNWQLVCAGAVAWLVLVVLPAIALALLLSWVSPWVSSVLGMLLLYFCIGGRSLTEHARAVAQPLRRSEYEPARRALSRIVSRDTDGMPPATVPRAAVESVLENGSDAVLAPVFWFVLAGPAGALGYRLANTLDAMWGYHNTRYTHFGRTAARMDDLLNWLPARACALGYALSGHVVPALRCWRRQAPRCESPNAGPVMAAGAGALGVCVGGSAMYGGVRRWRPILGEGPWARAADIERALELLWRTTGLWLLVIAAVEIGLWR